jgi:hypothetical protein
MKLINYFLKLNKNIINKYIFYFISLFKKPKNVKKRSKFRIGK